MRMTKRKRWAALGAVLGVVAAAPISTAAADTLTDVYDHPGGYTVQIPPNTTEVQIDAFGAAGGTGGSTGVASGGAGGRGAAVTATIPLAGSVFHPGDTLAVVVGGYAAGGAGGAGDALGHGGGAGGGAGIVYDLSSNNWPLVSA